MPRLIYSLLFAVCLTLASLLVVPICHADEGMYPVSEIAALELMSRGLEISPSDIFDPDDVCLIDGICKVNGCTGSFVSPQGLIITNHHCAYRAIQTASTPENDLLRIGFSAAQREQEIPATGYTVRIAESYRDVSDQVLSALTDDMDFTDRTKAIEKRQKEIEKAAEEANPAIRAEVAEMFAGKTYVLFEYTFIRDVRLVFAPPSSVGTFGGDIDNWEWPRHTGDFTFMRAYVAPDGSSADYAEENVPYQPKTFIQVAPEGVGENDFVFLLGYPGRTSRHKTSAFLAYEENVRLPFIVDLYQWQMGLMEEAGREDRAVALKHTSRLRSLANTEKRSRGQLKGLRRAQIVASRAAEESQLQSFIESDPQRKARYGTVLQDIAAVYEEMANEAEYELTFGNLFSACRSMSIAMTIYDAVVERQKDDLERESQFMDRNIDRTVQRMKLTQRDVHMETDRQILAGMLDRLSGLERFAGQADLQRWREADALERKAFLDKVSSSHKIVDPAFAEKCLGMSHDELKDVDEAFLQIVMGLYPEFVRLRELDKQREGQLDQLYGLLIEVKQDWLKTRFVPDANATLRMTFGRVEGYSPEDAVIKFPITTLSGVIEKTTGVEPFVTPDRIQEMYAQRDFGRFAHPDLGQVPVAILYSTDTTGGNSGSPVLNANGQLVGVNFDRAFEATINDFAWNHDYSRSIGVDIRYALWITGKVFGAVHLLDEMGVAE
ncbi:MAG: S46 family peptidase [Pirellulaceae bacterium]